MATSPNFNWPEPDNTDLVKNGALAIRTAVDAIDTSLVDLKGGTTGQVLSKASGTDMDFSWVAQDDSNAIQNAIVDAKGDLIAASAADTPARLAVGANGTVLTADSTEATGLKWVAAASGGGYTSIASGTISSAALNITSIPSTYKALVLELRDITKASAFDVNMQFNSDSGTNYGNVINRNVNNTLSTIGAIAATAMTINGSGFKASTQYNQLIVKIDAYAATDMWKICTMYGSGTDTSSSAREIWQGAGTWTSTSAITSIQTDSTMSLKYQLWGLN
jgi:hypothetical protein